MLSGRKTFKFNAFIITCLSFLSDSKWTICLPGINVLFASNLCVVHYSTSATGHFRFMSLSKELMSKLSETTKPDSPERLSVTLLLI